MCWVTKILIRIGNNRKHKSIIINKFLKIIIVTAAKGSRETKHTKTNCSKKKRKKREVYDFGSNFTYCRREFHNFSAVMEKALSYVGWQ